MIVNKYRPRDGETTADAAALMEATNGGASESSVLAPAAGPGYKFERPLPPDSLLRITEDFSPIYEMAFRPGLTGGQSRATLRTIERTHRAKMAEMANWTEAMRRAEAEKHRALKRIQDDMEVDQLRAQLKVMKNRLDEKSKDLNDNAHFLQQVAALRANYEKERGKQQDMLMESPQRSSSAHGNGGDEDGMFSSASRMSTGKKQKLYNALHYSNLYDEGEAVCAAHGKVQCPYCGGGSASPVSVSSDRSATVTPMRVHEKYFHQRPAPSLNYSPAKSQLNPLKTAPHSGSSVQSPVDVQTLHSGRSGREGRGSDELGSSRDPSPAPFGMSRKKLR